MLVSTTDVMVTVIVGQHLAAAGSPFGGQTIPAERK
jgi:hypothetical protein